jgi:ssDNA-binding Zn-finger/Zn-ribbon topoisomerase 1
MYRDEKYKPTVLKIFCPVCGQSIDRAEWNDYGMHLICSQYEQKKQIADQTRQKNMAIFENCKQQTA